MLIQTFILFARILSSILNFFPGDSRAFVQHEPSWNKKCKEFKEGQANGWESK